MRKAAPRLVAGGVGWADVHVFLTKMKANSYKMFGKINFKLFRIRCFSIFIFHFSFCIVTIGSQINIFFDLFLTKKGGWKNVCKNGVPRMGIGRHLRPPRLPPLAAPTRPDEMEKN